MPRTASSLYRDPKSPFWYAAYTTPDGRRVRQSTGCRDRGSAAAWLAARELERLKAGAGVPVARPTPLILATAEYLTERKPVWSKGWHQAVDAFVALRVIPHFGEGRTVATITRADVERFRVAQIGTVVRGGKPVSPATVNRLMAAMAAFGAWCMVKGREYHVENPWAKHEPLPEDDLPVPALEEEQIDKILAALDEPADLPQHGRRRYSIPWRLVVEFARETGLRKGELGRLAVADVDRKTRTVIVVSSRRRGRTKSRKSRPVPLSARALEILDALPERKDGLVFGPIPDPRAAFRTAAKAAGMERIWLHLFRHLFASRLAERGAGRADLRDAGGWSSSRMADRYTHTRMERLRDLIEGEPGQRNDRANEKGGQPES